MVRKIKPVSRVIRIEAEIGRIERTRPLRWDRLIDWDENWIPKVDVYEKPTAIVVEAEIPGVGEPDLVITVQSNRVEIKGMKKESSILGGIRYLRLEREFGSFRRLVALPATVVPDQAKAFLDNGVLILHLKKVLPDKNKLNRGGIRRDEE
ncbi:MAG: Hsp20/alpha crystallin family protein [Candidatus Aminicenantes bacterium]|nr:Hsp20/alpha crystallin family protein [Candidatus Aminicenantes bacterium]